MNVDNSLYVDNFTNRKLEMDSDITKWEGRSEGGGLLGQSAEYVKYAKIFGNQFWLIFIPTEDLGD